MTPNIAIVIKEANTFLHSQLFSTFALIIFLELQY